MKIWKGYGSEHSSNLVMIGTFKDADAAKEVERIIGLLIDQMMADQKSSVGGSGELGERYSDGMLKVLGEVRLNSIAPPELEQLLYECSIKTDGNKVVMNTDEIDVSVFLKIFLDKGARVEVYSQHPGTGE